jgi:hypothetical protein
VGETKAKAAAAAAAAQHVTKRCELRNDIKKKG